jgi:hypothetical protein
MAELGIDMYDARARERIEKLQWALAQRVLVPGATVIVEWGTWARSERDTLRERARELGAAVELRFLDAPLETLWGRVRTPRNSRCSTPRPRSRARCRRMNGHWPASAASWVRCGEAPLPASSVS